MLIRAIQFLCLLTAVPLAGMDLELVGQLRAQVSGTSYHAGHLLRQSGRGNPFIDGAANFRLNTQVYFDTPFSLRIDYEAGIHSGDTRRILLETGMGNHASGQLKSPENATRLLDLTHVSGESDNPLVYHRIDRLHLSWQGSRSGIHLGRQALSWGNGLIFNPADLLNPFAPTDIIRDYKVGTDMLLFQSFVGPFDDVQLAVVPRRDPVTGDVRTEQSSFAGKVRWSAGGTELDLLLARHYDESVIGTGVSGYLGGAAWRSDVIYTILGKDMNQSGYLSAVANIDYSWVLSGKNWYGLAEIFYNGIGETDPRNVQKNVALVSRLSRGELFTTAKAYFAGQLRYEHHPLVNFYLSVIKNLSDGSGILQPRITWDALQNLQIIVGADIPAGSLNSEFGGIMGPGNLISNAQPKVAYMVITGYF